MDEQMGQPIATVIEDARQDFSPESEAIVDNIQNGEPLTEEEAFNYVTTPEWREEHKDILALKSELGGIRERVSSGYVSTADFSRLCEICEFSKEDVEAMATAFTNKGILVDEYAEEVTANRTR